MKKYGVFALMLAIVLLAAGVHAQESGEVVLSGGHTIALPNDWEQAESEGVYTFSQGDLSITLTLPDVLASKLTLTADMDAADVLVEAYATLADQTLDKETDIQTQLSGERTLASYEFHTPRGRGITVVLEVTPGQFALMEFQAPVDAYTAALPDALQIMESLQVGEAAGASAEPCQVRAASAYVDLRVGPGANRGVYTSMTSGPYYGVLGKKTVSDGTLWWRLDMDTGAANELWVADADVETTGGCDQVADVDAPPLIFARPPAPPPAPEPASGGENSGGEISGGEAASSEEPTPNPSKIPANGMWSFAPAPEILVSCQGGPTEHYSSAELGITSGAYQVTASPDGSMVTLGTRVYYGRDGYYTSEETTSDGWYIAYHLYVSAPTQMYVDATIAQIGVPCSGTVQISAQYLG
jgi:hypothetical protein